MQKRVVSVATSGHMRYKIEKEHGLIVEKSLDNFCHFSTFNTKKSYSLSLNKLNYNSLVQRNRFNDITSCDSNDNVIVILIVLTVRFLYTVYGVLVPLWCLSVQLSI